MYTTYNSALWPGEQPGRRGGVGYDRFPGKVELPRDYTPHHRPSYDVAMATARGLVVESGFALLCLALAVFKLNRTRRDLLRDHGA
jgi:hypothetical protein